MRYLIGLWAFFYSSLAMATEESKPLLAATKVSELNASLFQVLYDWSHEAYQILHDGIVSLADFIETAEWLVMALGQPKIQAQVLEFSFEFSVSLAVALGLERLLTWKFKPLRMQLSRHKKMTHFWQDFSHVLLALMPIGVFGFAFYLTFRLLDPVGVVYLQIATIFINGVTAVWAVMRASKLLLVPAGIDSHLPFSKPVLTQVHRWFRRMSALVLLGYFTVEAGNIINLPYAGERLVVQLTTFVILVMALACVFSFQGEYRKWLMKQRREKDLLPWKRRFLSFIHFAPYLFVAFLVLGYMTWVLPLSPLLLWGWHVFGTIMLFPLLFYGQHLISLLREYWVSQYVSEFAPNLAKRLQYYQLQIDFVLSSTLTLFVVSYALWMWGVDPIQFVKSEMGQVFAERAFSLLVIFAITLFILRTIRGILNHYLNPTGVRGVSAAQRARLKTLNSISQSIVQVIIWIPAILLVLTELDIDILPAVATLGVLGLGLSFGVRSVVEDFTTGLFMLVENTFAVGDVVSVNGQRGKVESLTVRVLRLRALDGTLHSYPFGKITAISNYSREYAVAVLEIKVGRDADIQEVEKILTKVDSDLQKKDTYIQEAAMDPLVLDGVMEVTDSSITVRARVKTKPAMSWNTKRIYNKAIWIALDKKNVPLPIAREHNYNQSI